ncbi:WD40 repeat domain-containing protein [Leptolyngbya sp. PCC 6406]|uniref:WD40 repeat domain-containing protein n=1 Tax=Leptolyngbya sp. PCC 6406 TaxID=1173264 RepID=UPI0002AD0722|nr:WD40 repeat domain-containing protein [Leptolyngbya sp. PCC 6406]
MADQSDRGIRVEGTVNSSTLISGDGNTVYVIHQGMVEQRDIGPNPYMGLAAFGEQDADRYFGREVQVERLWQRLRTLYEQSTYADAVPRLLPILGPSGCGKSSLALAGLLPALTRRPLPSINRLRVAVMRPGAQPLEALAGVLAKVAFGDSMPVAKTEEFEDVLSRRGDDGLRRIVALMPQITASPLVLLVDQFEETYSLCKDPKVRRSFIDNLLCAAADPTGNVSVVMTLRSDFLGEAQRHQGLNQVVGSDQSAILPAMTAAELGRAIAEPAKRAGRPLETAVVDRLVQHVEGREGALPLLQYALFRIWEGLEAGREPLETYLGMGGVGGALASKAEEIYTALSASEQEIAERVFIGLVQVGEGDRDTRRQVSIKSLVTRRYGFAKIRAVIDKYSGRGARFITLATDGNGEMVAEVAHEALFKHWDRFMGWLGDRRDDIRLQQRLEAAAIYWDAEERPPGLLWRSPDLDRLRAFVPTTDLPLHPHCIDFFQASEQAAQREQRLKRLRLAALSIGLVLTTGLSIIAGYQVRRATLRQIDVYEAEARNLAESDPLGSMVSGLAAIGLGHSPLVKLPRFMGEGLVSNSILDFGNRHARFNRVIGSHEVGPISVAVSPNGELVVGGGMDGIQLWDQSGQLIGEPWVGHQYPIWSVAFSPDGETIASGEADGKVRLWNRSGQPIGEPFLGHQFEVSSVAFSPDGETIVSGGKDGTVRLWNRSGQLIGGEIIPDAMNTVVSVVFSPDGEIIASVGRSGRVRLSDSNGQLIGESWETHQGWVYSVAFSPDGENIVSGSEDGTLRLWDRSGQPIGDSWTGNQGVIASVTFSPDGETIASGGADGTVRLWNRAGQSIGEPLAGHQNFVGSVAFSNDGETIISGSQYGTVRQWNRVGQPVEKPLTGHQNAVWSVAFSPNGESIASGGEDGTVRLWNRQGHLLGEPLISHEGRVWSVAFGNIGRPPENNTDNFILASAGLGSPPRLWNLLGQDLGELSDDSSALIRSLAFSSDGETIVNGDYAGIMQLWSISGELIGQPLIGHQDVVSSVAFSPDGENIVSGSEDGTVRLWNRIGQSIGDPFVGHLGPVSSVVFSPDGQNIISGGEDGTVRLWDHQGQPLTDPFQGHQGGVWSVAISPDGDTIVSGSTDGTVRLWDHQGQPLADRHEGWVTSVAFSPDEDTVNSDGSVWVTSVAISPDGETIVSGSSDGTVRLWPLLLAEVGWVGYTCDRIRPYLLARSGVDETVRLARRTCERHAWR